MTPRLSFIIPTLGRYSLALPLNHLAANAGPEDEVFVVADRSGDWKLAKRITQDCLEGRCQARWGFYTHMHTPYGNGSRDLAITMATGDRLVFMDDDDTWLPGAIPTIRTAAYEQPSSPLIFKMRNPDASVLWHEPVLRVSNVGTPMFVPLRTPGLPKWVADDSYTSDFFWIERVCMPYQQGPPAWREEHICQVRPTQMRVRG